MSERLRELERAIGVDPADLPGVRALADERRRRGLELLPARIPIRRFFLSFGSLLVPLQHFEWEISREGSILHFTSSELDRDEVTRELHDSNAQPRPVIVFADDWTIFLHEAFSIVANVYPSSAGISGVMRCGGRPRGFID